MHVSGLTGWKAAGFTLLEVMVALVILGTSVAAVLGLLANGAATTQRTRTRVLATELAQERLEALLLDGDREGARGRFPAPYDAFRWTTRFSRGPVDGTSLAEVVVAGDGDSVHLATVIGR